MRQVERAIFDLRRGLPVLIKDAAGDTLVAPLEGLDDPALARLRDHAGSDPALITTAHRLKRMDITIRADAARIPLANDISAATINDWAYARKPASAPPQPLQRMRRNDEAALTLMRRGLLLPAAISTAVAAEHAHVVDSLVADHALLAVARQSIAEYGNSAAHFLKRVSAAQVPLAQADNTRFVLFREADGMREHVAILIGDTRKWAAAVPVRLHSACLTGDLFASLRCDCGEQLRSSVAEISARGGGALLYLAQEGRGIGLANKLRAYSLQDQGLDTIDADHVLGFGTDERDYNVALEMLEQLDIDCIDLLTNNPGKIEALENGGVTVAGRSGVYGRLTAQNRGYLTTKATRAGHWLESVLGGAPGESSTREREG